MAARDKITDMLNTFSGLSADAQKDMYPHLQNVLKAAGLKAYKIRFINGDTLEYEEYLTAAANEKIAKQNLFDKDPFADFDHTILGVDEL